MPTPPIEPTYKTVTLFNRKKALLENEQIKVKYDADVSAYQLALSKYKYEQDSYNSALLSYEQDRLAYEKAMAQYELDAAERKKRVTEFNKAAKCLVPSLLEKTEKAIKEIEDELLKVRGAKENSFDELFESTSAQTLFKFLSEEMKLARKEIKATVKVLNELYSYNVVFEKYRDLAILPTLYEYIDSGRCFDLRGGDGAYNLYESELRANIIFNKLDNLALALEQIKNNQIMLYQELRQINDNLEAVDRSVNEVIASLSKIGRTLVKIDSKLAAANKRLQSIDESSKETAQNSAQIANNTSVAASHSATIAYNSQVTAHNSALALQYAKSNGERLDAIAFAVSMR